MPPPPLFILCPGRSFSSVVCAIIGQHPECYGLPELDLFLGDTLEDSRRAYQRSGRTAPAGLLRALAELHSGLQTEETIEEAIAWVDRHGHWSGRRVLDHIQDLVGDRILVEKSPSNVFSDDPLDRLADAYPEASYLQLLRHPRSRGRSHQNAMSKSLRHKLVGMGIDYEGKWTETHLRIQRLADTLPPGAMLRLKGEAFLRDLATYLPQVCEWLGVSQDAQSLERMLHPEDSPYSRVGPANAPGGTNTDFLENPALDRDRLAAMTEPTMEAPLDWAPGRRFSRTTRALAHRYGYV